MTPEREIARIKGGEQSFDLLDYSRSITVYMGSAALNLLAREGRDEGGIFVIPQLPDAAPGAPEPRAWLQPGKSVRVGKLRGLEIFNSNGSRDRQNMNQIRSKKLREFLANDLLLAWEHTDIEVIENTVVRVRDLNTKLGTIVTKPVPYRETELGKLWLAVINERPSKDK